MLLAIKSGRLIKSIGNKEAKAFVYRIHDQPLEEKSTNSMSSFKN